MQRDKYLFGLHSSVSIGWPWALTGNYPIEDSRLMDLEFSLADSGSVLFWVCFFKCGYKYNFKK